MESQAVIVANTNVAETAKEELEMFCLAINSVMLAEEKKYLMANLPKQYLEEIKTFLPGISSPTVISLLDKPDEVAIHVVIDKKNVYESIKRLKQIGATGILILSVDQMIH
jgi:ATP phosphoribosyltransferase